MPNHRVLVVDDAIVIRRVVSDVINSDPELEVAATAVNGLQALEKLRQIPIEVVILDIEMPELDGMATLKALRKSHPRLPVIMFSTLTHRGAEATLDALSLGANDYFPKPSSSSMEESQAIVKEQLIPKIKSLIASENKRRSAAKPTRTTAKVVTASVPTTVELIVMGTSTGGPNALMEIFRRLPPTKTVPLVIVQHMPPMFTAMLAQRLQATSEWPVQEAADGMLLENGHAYIAPGDFHLEVIRDSMGRWKARTSQTPPEESVRPAANVLFRSAARAAGAHVLAVVLTGMGQDGKAGVEAIVQAGGKAIVQDEASSVVWGMPGAVAKAGWADAILPLDSIAEEITRRIGLAAASK